MCSSVVLVFLFIGNITIQTWFHCNTAGLMQVWILYPNGLVMFYKMKLIASSLKVMTTYESLEKTLAGAKAPKMWDYTVGSWFRLCISALCWLNYILFLALGDRKTQQCTFMTMSLVHWMLCYWLHPNSSQSSSWPCMPGLIVTMSESDANVRKSWIVRTPYHWMFIIQQM